MQPTKNTTTNRPRGGRKKMVQIGNTEIEGGTLIFLIALILLIIALTGFAIYCQGAVCLYR